MHADNTATTPVLLALALLLAACSDTPPATSTAATTTAPADNSASLVVPELMDWLVDPAAAVLLAAAGQHAWVDHAPRSDEAWQAVADAAAQLQRSSESLATPALAGGRPDWLQATATLQEAASAAAAAARRHDPRGLYLAGVQLRSSCQACHAQHAAWLVAAASQR